MSECIYYDNCDHACSSCKTSTAINKCLLGLNRLAADNTGYIVKLEQEIEKLKNTKKSKKDS